MWYSRWSSVAVRYRPLLVFNQLLILLRLRDGRRALTKVFVGGRWDTGQGRVNFIVVQLL
jgi:hypothetical protein